MVLRHPSGWVESRRQADSVCWPRTSSAVCRPLPFSDDEHLRNNLPDVLARWGSRATESGRARTEQSFLVPKADIVAQGYDLSLNRYKEVVREEVEHRDPLDIIADLEALEAEIQQGLTDLKAMLK